MHLIQKVWAFYREKRHRKHDPEARGSRIITACFKTKNKKITAKLKLKLRRNEVDQEKRKGRYNVDYLTDQKNSTRIQSYIK